MCALTWACHYGLESVAHQILQHPKLSVDHLNIVNKECSKRKRKYCTCFLLFMFIFYLLSFSLKASSVFPSVLLSILCCFSGAALPCYSPLSNLFPLCALPSSPTRSSTFSTSTKPTVYASSLHQSIHRPCFLSLLLNGVSCFFLVPRTVILR